MEDRVSIWRFIPQILLPLLILVLLDVAPLPHSVHSSLVEGYQARAGGQFSLAVIHLRQVVEQQPWRSDLWEQIGRMEWTLGRKEQALQDLTRARQEGSLSREGRILLAGGLEENGQAEAALRLWEELAQAGLADEQVYRHLTGLYRQFGRLDESLLAAQRWQTLAPQDPEAAFQLGMLLSFSDLEQAQALMAEAAAIDPAFAPAQEGLKRVAGLLLLSDDPAYRSTLVGRELAGLGAWDLAEQAFQQAVAANPDYAEAWAFLGEAQEQLGMDGLEALRRAEQTNPESVLAQALLTLYWSRVGAVDQALIHLQRAADIEPQRAVWQIELGALTARKGDLLSAQSYYEAAGKLEPKNTQVWLEQARFSLTYQVDLSGYGLSAAREAYRLAPEDAEVLDTMGAVFLGLDDLTTAERFLQQALAKDSELASVHLHLGQMYLIQAESEKARDSLLRAAALDEGGGTGLLAQRLLERHFP